MLTSPLLILRYYYLFIQIPSCLGMIYALVDCDLRKPLWLKIDDFRLKIKGMLSIKIKKTQRSLRLVRVVAPTPRRAIQQFFNLQSSIFNSGLSGLGFKSPAARRTLPITFPLFPSLRRFFRPWPVIFSPCDWLLSQRVQWLGSVQYDTW